MEWGCRHYISIVTDIDLFILKAAQFLEEH